MGRLFTESLPTETRLALPSAQWPRTLRSPPHAAIMLDFVRSHKNKNVARVGEPMLDSKLVSILAAETDQTAVSRCHTAASKLCAHW